MSLYKLSDELLLEIAQWVNTSGYIPEYSSFTEPGTKFLASLILCSHRLNKIATPVLYRTFIQTKSGALPAFLRTLSEKPKMGALVKKIIVYQVGEEEDGMDMGEFSREDLERIGLGQDVLEYFETSRPDWINDLERGNWQAVFALLLLVLPSLEEIVIASYDPGFMGNDYIETALEYAAHQQRISHAPHSLRSLKTVTMAYWDTEGGMSMEVILPYCALPSVKAARIHQASSFGSSSQRYRTQDLQIGNSNIAPEALVDLLRCFPSLKKLYYWSSGGTVGDEVFLPREFSRGIEHLKGCLEELTVLDYDGNFSGAFDEIEAIGSLAGFKKLRKLAINYACLLIPDPDDDDSDAEEDWRREPKLVHILPSSLELLAVSQCGPTILDQVQEVLEQRQNFPSLAKIILGFVGRVPDRYFNEAGNSGTPEPPRDLRGVKEKLIADGKEMGVDVVLLHHNQSGINADFKAAFHFDGVLAP